MLGDLFFLFLRAPNLGGIPLVISLFILVLTLLSMAAAMMPAFCFLRRVLFSLGESLLFSPALMFILTLRVMLEVPCAEGVGVSTGVECVGFRDKVSGVVC